MFETIILPLLVAIVGGISAILGAFIGAFFGGKYQLRAIEVQHQQELQEIENTNRELVQAYADSLIFQLRNLSEIVGWLEENNGDNKKYTELSKYIRDKNINVAKPQETRGYQIAFLIFQFMAAFWLSRTSRFSGMMTPEYKDFLDKWENKFEPIFCSRKYPGIPWLFREQIEIIAEEMLVVSEKTDITRPMHWKEFAEEIENNKALLDLADHLKSRIAFIFNDADNIENRQRTLSRLAFLGLYLTDIFSKYDKSDYIEESETLFWDRITEWCTKDELWFDEHDEGRQLYVFVEGDIQKRIK